MSISIHTRVIPKDGAEGARPGGRWYSCIRTRNYYYQYRVI
ncbi:MAG: hypothetical protein QW416_03705 [Candidatus Nitrosocaldaceae archaeon]